MTNLVTRDFILEVRKGNVTGHAMNFIYGHDEALGTTRTTIHPNGTSDNLDQSSIEATPATVKISSTDANDTSAGTGLRTLLLQGLDSSGDVQTETITLNGQTEVTSANTYSAITGFRGLTAGSTGSNEGTIWIGTGTVTAGVPATKFFSGGANINKGNSAYYVVPNGKTFYPMRLTITVATTNKDVEIYIETSTDGTFWVTEANFGMEPSEFQADIVALPGIAAGTHIRLEGVSSGAGTDVTAIIGGILVDD